MTHSDLLPSIWRYIRSDRLDVSTHKTTETCHKVTSRSMPVKSKPVAHLGNFVSQIQQTLGNLAKGLYQIGIYQNDAVYMPKLSIHITQHFTKVHRRSVNQGARVWLVSIRHEIDPRQ